MSSERKFLIEPVSRPDGSLLSITDEGDFVEVSMDTLKGGYSKDDVRTLVQGDFEAGLFIIGRAYFEAIEAKISDRVIFGEQLDEIHKR